MRTEVVKRLARECGFELAGVTVAEPLDSDFGRYERWAEAGMAGRMGYLTDRRAGVRQDPRNLLPGARSIICVGKLYNHRPPNGVVLKSPPDGVEQESSRDGVERASGSAIISQYAWGRDYHDVLREGLEALARKLLVIEPFEWKACVDTAPLLERSYARKAGLGWIGRNTCLIHEPLGSWFFLGELITSIEFEREDLAGYAPPPNRCGSCTRCIEACPTAAIVPVGTAEERGDRDNAFTIDARRCISYLNIELRGTIPEEHRAGMGSRIFGCDICQDVCPWNSRAPRTEEPEFAPAFSTALPLEELAYLNEAEFRELFRHTPVTRPKYDGFVRNVAVAMGAAREERFREPLEHLARHSSPVVSEHAQWALRQLDSQTGSVAR